MEAQTKKHNAPWVGLGINNEMFPLNAIVMFLLL